MITLLKALLGLVYDTTKSIFFQIEAASGKSVTYTSLRQEVITLATVLRAKGFGKGDVIGICSENKLEYPVPVLATLAIGATCAPLNPIYTTGKFLPHNKKKLKAHE